jgi:hypothetical protein
VLVDDLPSIRREYLRGSFVWDVIASVPYQYLECVIGEEKGAIVRALRLLKLIRLRRAPRMLLVLK